MFITALLNRAKMARQLDTDAHAVTRRKFLISLAGTTAVAAVKRTPFIEVASGGPGFILKGTKFVPWGFNYDHDEAGRLIENYWVLEWPKVEQDFREMRELGANVARIHLQFGRFMEAPNKPRVANLARLRRLLKLAEKAGLYLDLTGLGCYHKPDVPPWYDALSESERWHAQAAFWRAIARECRESPAIFCYDLMNEPIVPPSTGQRKDWLGPPFAGKYFVQFIALESKGRARPEIARAWIRQLANAIREVDQRHLITVGLVPWSLDKPGLNSGFSPKEIASELDFVSVHIYPQKGRVNEAVETLKGFAVGKPVVIEETFPLNCSIQELSEFVDQSRETASGWIGFYWGKTPEEYRKSDAIGDRLTLDWLEFFKSHRLR